MQPDIQQINTNLIWNENLKDKFVKNIDENDLKLILEEIREIRSTPEKIESITWKLTRLLVKSANSTLKSKKESIKNKSQGKPWFGTRCEKTRHCITKQGLIIAKIKI